MGKIFRYFKAREWLLVIGCALFVFAEVFVELKMPEYVEAITLCIEGGSPVKEIWMNGLYMLLCAIGAAACLLVVGFFSAMLGARLARRLRDEMYDKVMSFSLADINKFSMATLITRATNDVTQVQVLFAMGAQFMFRAPVMAIWAIVKVVQKSWQWSAMTAGAVVALIILAGVIMLVALPKFKKIQILTDNINRVMREQLVGVRVVRAYNAERFAEGKFGVANDELTRVNLSVNRALITINPLINIVMAGATIGVVLIGAMLVNSAVGFDVRSGFLADTMSMVQYVTQVLSGFLMLAMCFIMAPRALIAARRVTEILDVTPSILDPEIPAKAPADVRGEVEFRNVTFRYPDMSGDVIRDISFKAERGQTVAFIGSTGSGKSSLINLIPRFYDVSEGQVLVDGVDVREYAQKDLRKKIGYVPQQGVLFSGTVRDNVNYGDGAEIFGEDDIRNALEIAQADFVDGMENGLDSTIAQGGSNVSGGQRQRLAIARAICRKPEIYIFDDSFSALDFKTDKALRRRLNEATADATKLIVAQRVGTILDADKIIVLDGGEQVGSGTHKELMSSCDVYREIALSQLSEEELAC